MTRPSYYRRQAGICRRLSQIVEDPALALRLRAMADDFVDKADRRERSPGGASLGEHSPDGEANPE